MGLRQMIVNCALFTGQVAALLFSSSEQQGNHAKSSFLGQLRASESATFAATTTPPKSQLRSQRSKQRNDCWYCVTRVSASRTAAYIYVSTAPVRPSQIRASAAGLPSLATHERRQRSQLHIASAPFPPTCARHCCFHEQRALIARP